MVDTMDPETTWLNLTNAVLGLVTLVCLFVVIYAAAKEAIDRWVVKGRIPVESDTHAFHIEDLGITMADGGEPVDEQQRHRDDPPNIVRSNN